MRGQAKTNRYSNAAQHWLAQHSKEYALSSIFHDSEPGSAGSLTALLEIVDGQNPKRAAQEIANLLIGAGLIRPTVSVNQLSARNKQKLRRGLLPLGEVQLTIKGSKTLR